MGVLTVKQNSDRVVYVSSYNIKLGCVTAQLEGQELFDHTAVEHASETTSAPSIAKQHCSYAAKVLRFTAVCSQS